MARFNFVGPAYTSQSPNADAERCVNFYVEAVEGQGKGAAILAYTPGLAAFSTLATSPLRGQYEFNGRHFAVGGSVLYETFADGTNAGRGAVANDGTPATFAANPNELMVASGGTLYQFVLATNTLNAIADPTNVSRVDYIDSFFVATIRDSQLIRASAVLDGSTWDPLSVGQVSVYPENNVSMIVDHREIWIFGSKRSVIYQDQGATPFPFLPANGGICEQGCAATFSPIRMDNTIYWLGGDERGHGIAWKANGYTPVRVSNHAIEYAWSKYVTISDATSWSYQDGGHTFWVLYFPTANATWVYDAATQMWHERTYSINGVANAHLGMCHASAFGKHLVGDRQSGNIYQMSSAFLDDNGAQIIRMRRAPHISSEQQWIRHNSLTLDLDCGQYMAPQPGSSTHALSVNLPDDQGNTWKLTVNDAGDQLTITASTGDFSTIILNDSTTPNTSWQLMVVTDDAGEQVLATVASPFDVGFANYLQLATVPGAMDATIFIQNGQIATQTADSVREPQIMLRYSNDGGYTWSNQITVGCGAVGQYSKRVIARRLGRSRDRVYEVTTSDPYPYRFTNAYLDADPGFAPTERLSAQLSKGA